MNKIGIELCPNNATTQTCINNRNFMSFYSYYSGIFETDGEKNVGLSIKFEYTYEGETRSIEESQTLAKVDNVSILIKYKVLLYITGCPILKCGFWKC